MPVPVGSLWRVLPFVAPAWRAVAARRGQPFPMESAEGVAAWSRPWSRTWASQPVSVESTKFAPGTLLLVGATVPDEHPEATAQFVEIVSPPGWYVNLTHFMPGSERIERVA